jgi:hypothetical protein
MLLIDVTRQRRHLGKSQVIHVITEYSDKGWKRWIIYFILDTKISEESVFKLVQQKNYPVSKILYQWDDDEVRFILDQHAELDFYSASSLKQQSAGRNVTPFGHIILIPSQPIFAIPINDENCELSTLYWIPKFQKNQYLNLFNKRTTGYL